MNANLPDEIIAIIAQYAARPQPFCLIEDIQTFSLFKTLDDQFVRNYGFTRRGKSFFFINSLSTFLRSKTQHQNEKKMFLKMTPKERYMFYSIWVIILD